MRSVRHSATMWAVTLGFLFSALILAPRATMALTSPTLIGQASTPALVGGSMVDNVVLGGGASPTGSMTFDLYFSAFGGLTCTGTPVSSSTIPVSGNGSYTSGGAGPLAAGLYSWTATYSGDVNNSPVSTPCHDLPETVLVPQYCPSPATCAPTTCGAVNNTSSITTLSCTGTSALVSPVTYTYVGPANICAGVNESAGLCIPPGGEDIDTRVETVSVNAVAVPTLSLWGLGLLVAGLGALALKRLSVRSVS